MSKKKHEPYTMLKRTLASLGVTYKDIAKIIGCNEATVMLKINGESDFFISEMKKISETFGIPTSIFFTAAVA